MDGVVQRSMRTEESKPGMLERLRERRLVKRLRSGEPRAFEELVKRYQHKIFRLASRMTGSEEDGLDLAQEIFLTIHGSIERFRGESSLSTWVFRVARNHCLNALVARGRTTRLTAPDRRHEFERELSERQPGEHPLSRLEQSERRRLAARALALLEPELRSLILLRDIEELAYSEIAKIAQLPEGTVKSRLHRARALLGETVAALERGDEVVQAPMGYNEERP